MDTIKQVEKPNPPAPFPAREGGAGNFTPFSWQGKGETRNLTPLSLQGRGWGRGIKTVDST